MKKLTILFLTAGVILGLTACESTSKESDQVNYTSITMAEAKEIFAEDGAYIILDVRTGAEFEEGHIPNAICIPNEIISESVIEKLPDKDAIIYVYCRSGNRSKQAAEKLANLGYTNIIECGGIIDWDGEIVK